MPFSNYTLRRVFGVLWKWEANYRDEVSARGYSFSRGAARMSARGWLQSQGFRRSQAAERPDRDATEAKDRASRRQG